MSEAKFETVAAGALCAPASCCAARERQAATKRGRAHSEAARPRCAGGSGEPQREARPRSAEVSDRSERFAAPNGSTAD